MPNKRRRSGGSWRSRAYRWSSSPRRPKNAAPRSTIRLMRLCDKKMLWTKLPNEALKAYARELAKVVEASDVVLEVLDARDPAGSRSSRVESAVRRAPGKRLVLVLNKVDLVPREIATRWLDVLRSTGLAVVAFKASTKGGVAQSALDSAKDAAVVDEGAMGRSTALGVDGLLQLLKNYRGRWW